MKVSASVKRYNLPLRCPCQPTFPSTLILTQTYHCTFIMLHCKYIYLFNIKLHNAVFWVISTQIFVTSAFEQWSILMQLKCVLNMILGHITNRYCHVTCRSRLSICIYLINLLNPYVKPGLLCTEKGQMATHVSTVTEQI